ncbi:hypothetical protein [Desulfosediminicola flagellatus]|uniref:hypothetical protein n=1 Tax=Desulfosediminicola flagellatus TaxID=2569541 RepID=UPI00142ECA93|nr:hypothetical protein [Desulfosediminicola flagellatus]
MSKQVRTTLIFGVISALGAALLDSLPVSNMSWSMVSILYIWGVLVLYSILLCRWSQTALIKVLFPLALVPVMMVMPIYYTGYFLGIVFILLIFCWIRSGICFTDTPLRSILAEGLIFTIFVLIIGLMIPHTTYGLSIGIWLFFLMQTLYFYLVPACVPSCKKHIREEPFEHAFKEMEKIFSNGFGR